MATPSPSSLVKGCSRYLGSCCSSPEFSPSSDQRFWSNLRRRVDALQENRKPSDEPLVMPTNVEAAHRTKRLKEDSLLLIRGFDSVAQTLSQLSSSLDNALQGAEKLAEPPSLREIARATFGKAEEAEENPVHDALSNPKNREDGKQGQERITKRKLDSQEIDDNREDSKEVDRFKRVKNLAISMAAKAATLSRELKSIKSDLGFERERCALLEEENNTLRQGLLSEKAVSPEEDDLVRLQLEALLAEKSRLANENANLLRENRCLHQLVEYHQLTSHDVSASYENLVRGMCLDFDSPPQTDHGSSSADTTTPPPPQVDDVLGFNRSLNQCFDDEEKQ